MDCRELPCRGRSRPEPLPPVITSPPPPPQRRGLSSKSRNPSDPPPTPSKAPPTSTTPPSSTSTPDKIVNDSNKNKSSDAPKSNFQKTVSLADWWLVKAEPDSKGKRLAIAGFTSREQQAVRVFSSAPILRRYDVFTLETTDGICVIIKGFMNKARTVENGFPSEVCNHFIFGFPTYWEEYAEKCMAEDSPSKNVSEHILTKLSPQPETVAGIGDSRNDISKQDEKSVGKEAHVDSLNKDFRLMLTSKGDKMEIRSILKSRKRICSTISSSQKPRIGGMCSLEGILCHSEAGGSKSSTRKLEKNQMDYRMSPRTSRYGKIRLTSASVGSRTNLHFAAVGLEVSTDETNSSELDADSVDKLGHKSMDRESPSEDTLQSNLVLQKLSPRLETVAGEEACVDSHKRDLGLIQDRIDYKGMLESTQTESSTVLSLQTSSKVVRGAESKLYGINTSSAFPIASGGPEKESTFGDQVIENPSTLEMSENCPGNRIKSLAPSMLMQKFTGSAIVDKDVNSSQNHETKDDYSSKTIEDHTKRNPISACRLNKKRRCKNAFDNEKIVKLDEQLSNKTRFDKDISSSEEVLNHTEGRALMRSTRKLEGKWKDGQLTARVSDDGEFSSDSVSLDGKSDARNSLIFADSGCKEPTDATYSKSYVDSVEPKFDQKDKPSMRDKVRREFITKASTKKGKNRAKSSTRSAAPDNRRKNNNISENAKASGTEAKRKLTYGSPEKENANISIGSPQPFSFNRSRSGRLLMPTLEFWRNQRAIYNADRTITGIGEGLHLGQQPTRGSRSEPQRKRRKLQ